MKTCNKCKTEKAFTEFYKGKRYSDGYQNRCKPCVSAYNKERNNRPEVKERNKSYRETYGADPGGTRTKRNYELSFRYGITIEEYERLLEKQNHCCAVCLRHTSEFKRSLAVDHDHSCCPDFKSCGKCVRGLLCSSCNTSLGSTRDNKATLYKLINYLESSEQ